ncbi:MAG TPA: plastocyanin/azurin family copper-binding protein [Solirubrobacteraceae bacterium]|nr:plastocyanin/azurin family copper-binding protein [Solirubrobacteraceae bacterium]
MHRGLIVLIASSALALAAGCGSSSSSSGVASSATATTPATTTTSTAAASLRVTTTPRFAVPAASEPVQGGVVGIAYRNITINPDTLRVKVGTTVRWTNYDPVEHNVTSKSGPQRIASKNFGEGKTFEVKLTRPGVIHYECTIHPATMNGTIEVVK